MPRIVADPTYSRPRSISFGEACAKFVHRFTMDHVPAWAKVPPAAHSGTETRFYAPQYRSDREWFERTRFHGEPGHLGKPHECTSTGQTWPLGQWLDRPYQRGQA